MALQTPESFDAVRLTNYLAVLEEIALHGPQPQVRVAEHLRLSQASVSRAATALIRHGLLVEVGRIGSKAGRRQVVLDINPRRGTVGALQLHSNSLRLRLSDLKGMELVTVEHYCAPRDLEDLLSCIIQLFATAAVHSLPVSLAFGVPGAWDSRNRYVHAIPNAPFLEEVDLEASVTRALKIDTLVDNDVNFATIGEHSTGVAIGTDNCFYLNMDAGVGGGIIIGGKLHHGERSFAGEVGYLPIPWGGRLTPFEDIVSLKAIDAALRERGLGENALSYLNQNRQEKAGSEGFSDELARAIALAAAAIITVLSPELIILGGRVGRRMGWLIPTVMRHLQNFVRRCPRIEVAHLGKDASLIGGTAQVLQRARRLLVSACISEVATV